MSPKYIPKPCCEEMGLHDEGSKESRKQVGADHLQGTAVDAHNANRGCPFMVQLVVLGIELGQM